MEYQGFELECHEKSIFGQLWKPSEPEACMILIHGLGEHSGRYSSSIVPELTHRNIAVIGFDLFGHGHSEGKRGCCPGYDEVLDLVDEVILKGKEWFSDIPMFIFGHSLGGNIALSYVMKRKHDLKGILCSGPFLRTSIKVPAWKMIFGKLLWKIAPEITLSNGIEPEALTSLSSEVRKLKEDPLCHTRICPNYAFPFMLSGEWILQHADLIKIPAYIGHGTDDHVTSHWASKALSKQNERITLKLYEGGRHEILNDSCRSMVNEDILVWMNSQLSLHLQGDQAI
ncbi:alpha/beta hydrolase [Robertkochia solimangrovi]|uniref:alpha/beta hydrolase n=1 Tax=Robertkochia solimangrovi TaxID=2213046 RepID=UPI0011808F2F|nr:alpha/beta hydrolase [Robertkochia solimangrovi]TRZ42550.1 alpha/beta hydrolase [Robertkochia solimangrovi]